MRCLTSVSVISFVFSQTKSFSVDTRASALNLVRHTENGGVAQECLVVTEEVPALLFFHILIIPDISGTKVLTFQSHRCTAQITEFYLV